MIRWPGVVPANTVNQAITSSLDWFPTLSALAGAKVPTDRAYDGFDLSPILFDKEGASASPSAAAGAASPLHTPQPRSQPSRYTLEYAQRQLPAASAAGSPFREMPGPRDHFYYHTTKGAPRMQDNSTGGLMAIRKSQYKLHFFTQGSHCTNDYFDKFCYAPLQDWRAAPLLYNLETDPGEVNAIANTTAEYSAVVPLLRQQAAAYIAAFVPDVPPSEIGKGGDAATRFPCCSPGCTPRPACCECAAGHRPI